MQPTINCTTIIIHLLHNEQYRIPVLLVMYDEKHNVISLIHFIVSFCFTQSNSNKYSYEMPSNHFLN